MDYCDIGRTLLPLDLVEKFDHSQNISYRFSRVKLEDPDSDDEEDNCTLVVGVIQKNRRKIKKVGAQNLTIGFSIYKVKYQNFVTLEGKVKISTI